MRACCAKSLRPVSPASLLISHTPLASTPSSNGLRNLLLLTACRRILLEAGVVSAQGFRSRWPSSPGPHSLALAFARLVFLDEGRHPAPSLCPAENGEPIQVGTGRSSCGEPGVVGVREGWGSVPLGRGPGVGADQNVDGPRHNDVGQRYCVGSDEGGGRPPDQAGYPQEAPLRLEEGGDTFQ